MKRSLFLMAVLISLFSLGTTGLYAGDNDFGIRGGYQSAALYKSDSSQIDNNLNGFYLGFYRDIKLVSFLKLGFGLEYSTCGSTTDSTKHNLNYVNIPINIKVGIGPVYALAGTGANILVGETYTENDKKRDPQAGETSNGFDMPFYLGAGAKIAFIGIEARYNWGLLDIGNNINNRYLQVGLTLSF